MDTSTAAKVPPHREDDGQKTLKPANYEEEARAESKLFDNLSELWADLRRIRLQWLEGAINEERRLQQDFIKAQDQRNQEFLMAYKARQESFETVHATEIRNFENSHKHRELEFQKNHKAREEQHQQHKNDRYSMSLAMTEQDVDSEHLKLQRQAEDEHEASQFQHKHNDKMARREREDSYHRSEEAHKANHRHGLKQLQHKFDVNGDVLRVNHKQSWDGQGEDIRTQIEQSQAMLMLKLFGPSDFQDPSKPKSNPTLDLQTPPPDMSTSPSDQASIIPTDPEQSLDKPNEPTIPLPPISNPFVFGESWQVATVLEAHSPPRAESGAMPLSRPSAQLPSEDTNRDQRTQLTPQDECQIQVVERIFQELGDDCRRKDLWDRVSEEMKKKGYLRDAQSAAAKWSALLRQVCEDRGYVWAERVMKKAPYKITRKRRTISTADEIKSATPTSTSSRPGKRIRQSLQHHNTVDVQRSVARPKLDEQGKSFYGRCISMNFSSDVTQLDWSLDGKQFLVGSMAIEEPIENKPCNLALGSMETKNLREMQNTHFSYGGPDVNKGLYRTVTAAQFSAKGDHALTAGYDRFVRIWDLHGDDHSTYVEKVEHENKVIVMALGRNTNLLATGIQAGPESLQVWRANEDFRDIESVGIPYKKEKGFEEYPMSLAFGTHQATQNWLVAGFAWDDDTCGGRLDVWSVDQGCMTERHFKPNHSQVFEVAWFPSGKGFIAGTSSSMLSSTERSCVQFYNVNEQDSYLKLSCPAVDMNIVTICPYQEELVTASCTDGKVYVWDIRNPKTVLHTLTHGASIREQCGVWMTEWLDRNFLFTGSSDGCLKRWDLRLSAQDVFAEDVYECDAEIMSGSFSPDKSTLILGDGNTGLHLLRRRCAGEQMPVEEFTFVGATDNQPDDRTTVGITNMEDEISMNGSPLSPASPASPNSPEWPHYSPGFI